MNGGPELVGGGLSSEGHSGVQSDSVKRAMVLIEQGGYCNSMSRLSTLCFVQPSVVPACGPQVVLPETMNTGGGKNR